MYAKVNSFISRIFNKTFFKIQNKCNAISGRKNNLDKINSKKKK